MRSKYLIVPRHDLAYDAVSLEGAILNEQERKRQVARLVEASASHSLLQNIKKEVLHFASDAETLESKTEASTAITSIVLADMSPDEAGVLQSRFGDDVYVLEDRPLALIGPTASLSAPYDEGALWHFETVGLDPQSRREHSGEGTTVAVLDTGVDGTHPELHSRFRSGWTWNSITSAWESQSPSVDTATHGTHVAGTICGERVGIAPGAQFIALTMIPYGRGMLSDFVRAMEWVGSSPEVDIMCMSAGIRGYVPGMEIALEGVRRSGTLPVIAIGNEGRNRTRSPGNYRSAMSVGATTHGNNIANFSGGGTMVSDRQQYHVPDLVAPGVDILSCVPNGGYETSSGTSMATPVVAGVAARMLQRMGSISVPELSENLLANCLDLGFRIERQGAGLIQV